METLILESNSKDDLQLFFKLAKKAGILAKFLSKNEKEDIAITMAIQDGETGEYIDKDDFLNELRK